MNRLRRLHESAPRQRAVRILLVDDNDEEAAQIRRHLERSALRASTLDIVGRLRAAADALAAREYDIVLLDLRLPDGGGLHALARLQEAAGGTPIVVLASLGDGALGLEAVRRGAQDYAVKQHLNATAVERIVQHAVERAFSQRALATAHESYRRLFTNLPVGLFRLSAEGELVTSNPALLRLLGVDDEESLERRGLRAFFKDPSAHAALMDVLERRGRVTDHEIALVNAHGERVDALLNCAPVQGNGDGPSGWEVCLTDISGLKRAERERDQLELELRLAHKLEAIGQLAAGVAHEINTPAQYVGDNLMFLTDMFEELVPLLERQSLLLELAASAVSRDDERYAECAAVLAKTDLEYALEELPAALRQSREGVDQIRKIVLAMKQFSHPGSEGKEAVDINDAVENVLTVSRNEWKYVADVELELDRELPLVPCVLSSLNQVLLNLIVNAAHAIESKRNGTAKGTITVRTRTAGNRATIDVADTGCGIPPEIRSRIFDPFFTTKEVGKGTGQGLALAHSVVVDGHGGAIAVKSEVGVGTTFSVSLPLDPQLSRTAP